MQYPDFIFETLPEDPTAYDLSVPYIEYYPTRRRHHNNNSHQRNQNRSNNNNQNNGSPTQQIRLRGSWRDRSFNTRSTSTVTPSLATASTNSENIVNNNTFEDWNDTNLYGWSNHNTLDATNTSGTINNNNSNNSTNITGYAYRCLLCQRQDLCEQGIKFHCMEPYHLEHVEQLLNDKRMAQILLDKWYRSGVVGKTNNRNTTMNALQSFQYRIENNLGLPAWRYHVESLLYRYMRSIEIEASAGGGFVVAVAADDDFFDATTNSNVIAVDDDGDNLEYLTAVVANENDNNLSTIVENTSRQLLANAYSVLKRYEYMERLSLLELAIWKAVCIVEMKPVLDNVVEALPITPSNTSSHETLPKQVTEDTQKIAKSNDTSISPVHSTSSAAQPAPMDYFATIEWTRNGWKCNKAIMRKTNAFAIIIEHVVPFLGMPQYHHQRQQKSSPDTTTSSLSVTNPYDSFTNCGSNNHNNNSSYHQRNTSNITTGSGVPFVIGRTARPRPWVSSLSPSHNNNNTNNATGGVTSSSASRTTTNPSFNSFADAARASVIPMLTSSLSSSTASTSSTSGSISQRRLSSRSLSNNNIKHHVTIYNFNTE